MAKTHGAAKAHVAPVIRSAFIKALEIRGQRFGKTLPELMDELIEQEGMLAVLDRVAKFQERITSVDMQHSGDINLVSILGSLAGRAGHDTEVEEQPDSVRH